MIRRIRNRKGLTLVELMVVIALVGAAMAILGKLLSSLWQEEFQSVNQMDLAQIFKTSREKALGEGFTYTLEFNLDKREVGVRPINPARDGGDPSESLYYSLDEDAQDEAEKEPEWFIEPVAIPKNLKEILSLAGTPLSGPLVHIYFYPDGTCDPIIIHYENGEYPYLFIPRHASQGILLKTLTEVPPE